jgi:hypothetical protein
MVSASAGIIVSPWSHAPWTSSPRCAACGLTLGIGNCGMCDLAAVVTTTLVAQEIGFPCCEESPFAGDEEGAWA